MTDTYNLERFVAAQDGGGTYGQALSELQLGNKPSHWMWFIFPQLAGLGSSPTSVRYAITSLAEAQAFLSHHLHDAVPARCARRDSLQDGTGTVLWRRTGYRHRRSARRGQALTTVSLWRSVVLWGWR
ncbi:uncharacterized protein (DUF1810 family) [Arthrobacter sp. UYEF21]